MVNEDAMNGVESGEALVQKSNDDESSVDSKALDGNLHGSFGRTSNNDIKDPLIQESDKSRQEKFNTKTKHGNIAFSSGNIFRRDHLSSTSSRMNLGFGSLDIIMEKDKSHMPGNISPENDPYVRPQKWGWAVVIASWIVMIPIAGVLASFGTIVSALTEEFNATKLESGWIGSLAFSFTVGTCPLSTPLFIVFGARKVAFVGVVGATISLIVTSFAPVLYLFFLTYSFMLGTFANFVYNSAMNLTGQYFPFKHQALATCLASAGISFGTLLVNPFSRALVDSVGWRHTLRILSGGILVIGLGCVAVFRPVKKREQIIQIKIRGHKEKKGHEIEPIEEALAHTNINSLEKIDIEALTESIQNFSTESKISLVAHEIKISVFNRNAFDCSVCNNPAFILWMLGTLLWSVSFLFPVIFLIDYMSTIGVSVHVSPWVLTAYGIAEFVGRLVCAFGAGKIRFSLAYAYTGGAVFIGFVTILTPLGRTLGTMFTYAICSGLGSGVLNSLMYAGTMQFFGNEKGRHVWGYINVMLAAGVVVGPVAAGGIFDATQSYEAAFYLGGSMFILCAFVMGLIPCTITRYPVTDFEENILEMSENSRSSQNGSIVKPGALRKLAHQLSALRGKVNIKSKWSKEVPTHLRELHDTEEQPINEKKMSENGQQKRSSKNGSIVKPGALRKLTHQLSALRGKVNIKSKWNKEVPTHLRELHDTEEQLINEKEHSNGKHVTMKLPVADA